MQKQTTRTSVLLAIVLFSTNLFAVNPTALETIVKNGNPNHVGLTVGIYKHGKPLFRKGFGLRDRGLPETFAGSDLFQVMQTDKLLNLARGKLSPNEGTVYSIGSVSKEFTAGAILLLQQEHKLSVHDKLAKYFPHFPDGHNITLLDLLHHTSGITDYNYFPQFAAPYADFMQNRNYDVIEQALEAQPLLFTPGTQYKYSNSNYLLLGMIVDKVSNKTLQKFLGERIFNPLQMTHTHNGYKPSYKDAALGYTMNGSKVERAYAWNLKWLAGPGGLTSTIEDIAKWDHAVSHKGLFTQESLTQMFTPSNVAGSTYACGWVIDSMDGHKYVWHNGEVGGFHTMNATFPDLGLSIIVLGNNDGFAPENLIKPLFEEVLAHP